MLKDLIEQNKRDLRGFFPSFPQTVYNNIKRRKNERERLLNARLKEIQKDWLEYVRKEMR